MGRAHLQMLLICSISLLLILLPALLTTHRNTIWIDVSPSGTGNWQENFWDFPEYRHRSWNSSVGSVWLWTQTKAHCLTVPALLHRTEGWSEQQQELSSEV